MNNQEPTDNADVSYVPDFLGADEATEFFNELMRSIQWTQYLNGWGTPRPRREAWHGDPGCVYASYNNGMQPLPWTEALLALRAKVEEATRCAYNGVLLNLYKDRHSSVDWHSDDDPEFGHRPTIASVSLGETRRFVMRHKTKRIRRTFNLAHGSLLVMAGDTQSVWEHKVPKETFYRAPRINVTFRLISNGSQTKAGRLPLQSVTDVTL